MICGRDMLIVSFFSLQCVLMPKEYLHFDEIEDVLSSLDLLAMVIPLVNTQTSYWKWTIIAAHAGLQGAMVCALRGTSGLSVLDEKFAQKMLEWFDTRKGGVLQERMADFSALFDRCRESKYMAGQPLKLSRARANDIVKLHKHFRNNFAHFTPKRWSIEIAGLPRIVGVAVDSIETLMEHPQVIYKLSGNRKRRLVVQARLT
jgi:hypothetical protein